MQRPVISSQAKIILKRLAVLGTVFFVVAAFIWYTRPLSIRELTHGLPIGCITVSEMSARSDAGSAPVETSDVWYLTTNPEEIQKLLLALETDHINRRVTLGTLIGMPYILGSLGLDGLVYSTLTLDTQTLAGEWETLRITAVSNAQTSDNGKMTLERSGRKVPAGIGRFGQEKSIQFQQTLQGLLEACVDNPQWERVENSVQK